MNSCFEIAAYIIYYTQGKGYLSRLKLQKLLYFAQGWYSSLYGEYLSIPGLFNKYQIDNTSKIPLQKPKLQKKVGRFLKKVVIPMVFAYTENNLNKAACDKLWIKARKGIPLPSICKNIIKKKAIKRYFRKEIMKGLG